jgi:hypothetical protein
MKCMALEASQGPVVEEVGPKLETQVAAIAAHIVANAAIRSPVIEALVEGRFYHPSLSWVR